MKFGSNAFASPEEDIAPLATETVGTRLPPAPIDYQLNNRAYLNVDRDGDRDWKRPELPVKHSAFQLQGGAENANVATTLEDIAIYLERCLPWVRLVAAPVVYVRKGEGAGAQMVETLAAVVETSQAVPGLLTKRIVVSILLSTTMDTETLMRAFWAMLMKAFLLEARYIWGEEEVRLWAAHVRANQHPTLAEVPKTPERRIIDAWLAYVDERLYGRGRVITDASPHARMFYALYEGYHFDDGEHGDLVRQISAMRDDCRRPGEGIRTMADQWDDPSLPPIPPLVLDVE